jgi:hypothetical protein
MKGFSMIAGLLGRKVGQTQVWDVASNKSISPVQIASRVTDPLAAVPVPTTPAAAAVCALTTETAPDRMAEAALRRSS